MKFPVYKDRDLVTAQFRLITEVLGISHLVAITGISSGADNSLQFAVSYPQLMDGILPVSGGALWGANGRLRGSLSLSTLDSCKGWDGGNYDENPKDCASNLLALWAQYFYTPAIHYAAREGHLDAVRLLLDAGADAEQNGYYDGSLVEMARDRGHLAIVSLLEEVRGRTGLIAPSDPRADHPIHLAAEAGDLKRVRALLDDDPTLVNRGDRTGGSPLHRAVLGRGDAESGKPA